MSAFMKWPKWARVASLLFFALCIFVGGYGFYLSTIKPAPALSFAAKISSIDANRQITEDAPETGRVRVALKAASAACGVTEIQIGNAAAKVNEILRSGNTSSNIVDLLEALPQVATPGVITDCPKLLSYYAGIRKSGQGHLEATVGLRELIALIGK